MNGSDNIPRANLYGGISTPQISQLLEEIFGGGYTEGNPKYTSGQVEQPFIDPIADPLAGLFTSAARPAGRAILGSQRGALGDIHIDPDVSLTSEAQENLLQALIYVTNRFKKAQKIPGALRVRKKMINPVADAETYSSLPADVYIKAGFLEDPKVKMEDIITVLSHELLHNAQAKLSQKFPKTFGSFAGRELSAYKRGFMEEIMARNPNFPEATLKPLKGKQLLELLKEIGGGEKYKWWGNPFEVYEKSGIAPKLQELLDRYFK